MKKYLNAIFCVLLLSILLIGCNSKATKSYTFTVDNGDEIKIAIDTSDKYDISSEIPFAISCDGEILSQGSFIKGEAYEQYVSVVESDDKAELLDSGTKDGHTYIFWCYNGSEYNYAILIDDSRTGIILGNLISEESARECFNRIDIIVED